MRSHRFSSNILMAYHWNLPTRFLPTHPFHPKEFFLASTRGVYRSLRVSSQVFSALRLGLGDILLPAFHLRICRCHQCSGLALLRDAVLASTSAWAQRRETPMEPNGTGVAFSPPWNLDTLCSWAERGGKTSKEVSTSIKDFLQLGTAGMISSPFFSLFSTKQLNTSFPLEVPLLLC